MKRIRIKLTYVLKFLRILFSVFFFFLFGVKNFPFINLGGRDSTILLITAMNKVGKCFFFLFFKCFTLKNSIRICNCDRILKFFFVFSKKSILFLFAFNISFF